ncbi:MAG TPA: acyl carrier protein [Prolixibacteraceae bacterium]|jgi:acyl carrier protein
MENKTMNRILYKVLRKTGVPRNQIKLDASFDEDLNFDKVDWALFVYYLEGFFKIHLEDREISELSQVDDTLKIVNKRAYSGCL